MALCDEASAFVEQFADARRRGPMGILSRCFVLAIPLSIAACALPVWEKPGTTRAEVNADKYACEAQARALNPGGSYAQGSVGFVVAATLVSAVATAADRSALIGDCMTARGYAAHQAGAAAPPPEAAGTSLPAARTPAGTLQLAATQNPATTAVEGPGRVVLFPVTIYNPYYPSAFVNVQ
jgi:hypothetical protein